MGVDWMSPEQIQHSEVAFVAFTQVILGIYVWECLLTLDFEYKIITRRLPFKWPLIFYFLNRYCILGAMVGFAIAANALYTYIQVMGSLGTPLAAVNLGIRTIAVWQNHRYLVGALVILHLGHTASCLGAVTQVLARWSESFGCIITHNQAQLITGCYAYTVAIDFIVMCLMAYKLGSTTPKRSKIIRILFEGGLVYFVVACLSNTVAVIFSALNLNPTMSVIALVPDTVLSSIAACRAVRRLSTYVTTQSCVIDAETIGRIRRDPRIVSDIVFNVATTRSMRTVPDLSPHPQ
uniref:Transmembrane protein n=1 Tax=Moniliophthora roreri TaxID=221103 RepID=A0A0W0FRB0_MONRR